MNTALSLGLTASALLIVGACSKSSNGGMGAFSRDDEEVVRLADCPEPVRATIEREAANGKLGEVERETEDGQTTYSAEIEIDGQQWEVEVDPDGTVVERELDDDDGDDDEDD